MVGVIGMFVYVGWNWRTAPALELQIKKGFVRSRGRPQIQPHLLVPWTPVFQDFRDVHIYGATADSGRVFFRVLGLVHGETRIQAARILLH